MGSGEKPLNGLKFYTVPEVAEALRVHDMTVYRLLYSGELESIRIGRSFRIPVDAFHDYLERARRREPSDP